MLDDDVLLLLAAAWAALVLVGTVRSPALREAGRRLGWVVAASAVLALVALLAWTRIDGRGWIALAAAALLLVIPLWLARLYFWLILGQRYRFASLVTAVLLLLHPTRALLVDRAVLVALRRAASGDASDAAAKLGAIADNGRLPEPMRLSALAWSGRIRRDWPGVVALPDGVVTRAMRLRGFGELGQTEALVANYLLPGRDTSPLERLMVLAFCGRAAAVERLISGPLAAFRPDTQAFWLATAQFAAGETRAGEASLRRSVPRDMEMRASFADRLSHPPPVPTLTPATGAIVDTLASEVVATPLARVRRPWATYALILLNFAMFAVEEASGGSTDDDTLYRLGALSPETVFDGGEVWRIGAALFLHDGYAHVLFNMAALAAFGARLERQCGPLRFTLVYLGAGLLSMGSVLALTEAGVLEPALLVGASGAIMGLVGASAGLAVRALRTDRFRSLQTLRSAAVIVGLQSAFDWAIPHVSFSGHISGTVAGFLLALAMPRGR